MLLSQSYQYRKDREISMADKIREGKVRCSFCNKSEDLGTEADRRPGGSVHL